MNALRKLEKGGYRFELLPDGRLHYQDMWPSAGSRHWAAPLLAEVIALTIYFIPTIVAYHKRRPNTTAIGALNLLLGWSFVFWVVALVWALKND